MKNLEIYNQLKEVPQKYLKTIQAGRLKGMSDIKPQWRIEKMTEVFGICGFGWKIKDLAFEYKQGSDNQVVCVCRLNLYVKIDDVWSDAIPGTGGSSFISNEKNGAYTSDEAEKMAYTDAISVATKMLGLASDIYMGHGGKYDKPTEQTKQPQPQPQTQTKQPQTKIVLTNMHDKYKSVTEKLSKGETTIQEVEKYFDISQCRNELENYVKLSKVL